MPQTDPPEQPKDDPNKDIQEQIAALSDTLAGFKSEVQEGLDGLKEEIDGVKNPIVEEKKEDPPKFQPKSWDDIPKTAAEIAEQTYERKEKEKQDKVTQEKLEAEEADKNIQKEIDTQMSALEKSGMIPPIKDAGDERDPGRSARRELFGMAADMGTTNLEKVAETMNELNKQNIHYDFKSKKYLRTDGAHVGQDSPIGSSGRYSGSDADTGPSYKTIHKAKSLSELARLARGG